VNPDRIEAIRVALDRAFPDSTIRIADESHRHAGHAGAKSGRGHFALELVSSEFVDCGMLQRHKKIYSALGGLMESDIHALKINARAPDEL
jgi:BolA protein